MHDGERVWEGFRERDSERVWERERECGKDWDGEREDVSMRKRERMCV